MVKCCNLVGCILTFPSWCGANCMWYCLLSPCAMAINKLGSASTIKMIFLTLCFFLTPFLCILGAINWCLGLPKTVDNAMSFLDTGSAYSGFKDLIHPEEKTSIISSGEGLVDSIFKC